MSFKDNLLKKIEIEALAVQVISSIGAPDSGVKIDRKAMLELLGMIDFTVRKERDLDLYVRPFDGDRQDILVLDNELALYRSTIADVALRKSPTLKEMISIRNAIKILNDKDVVLTKRSETVTRIRDELVGDLDLSYTVADLDGIVKDGVASLATGYGDGVVECLLLLAEMIGYRRPPKAMALEHYVIFGALEQDADSKARFGPLVAYSNVHNTLKWIDQHIDTVDKGQIRRYREEVVTDESSDNKGEDVLKHLGSLIQPSGIII